MSPNTTPYYLQNTYTFNSENSVNFANSSAAETWQSVASDMLTANYYSAYSQSVYNNNYNQTYGYMQNAISDASTMNTAYAGFDVSWLANLNGAFGTAVSAGEVFSLAGQGLYMTSRGTVAAIDETNLTLHSLPYYRTGQMLKGWGVFSSVFGFALDTYAFTDDQISGAKYSLNISVTAWGYVIMYP